MDTLHATYKIISLSKIFIIGIYPDRDYTFYLDFVCWCVHTLMYYAFVERFYIKISSFLAEIILF